MSGEQSVQFHSAAAMEPTSLPNVVCPACHQPFCLEWEDYRYDYQTRAFADIVRTVFIRYSVSGGIYGVEVRCPHCRHAEDL